jgi:hypothetical protein
MVATESLTNSLSYGLIRMLSVKSQKMEEQHALHKA